jgi:hypothetical protein
MTMLKTSTGRGKGAAFALLVFLAGACVGEIGGVPGDEGGPSAEALGEIGVSGMRRLTAAEYDATLSDLLGVDAASEAILPEDLRTPFDNDFTIQQASEALINSADSLAGSIAGQVTADPALRDAIMPCTPSATFDRAADTPCFRQFVETFGRRALRRPLATADVDLFDRFIDHAETAGDFWIAIDSALRAFLQHPEFLYRVELGEVAPNDPAAFKLNDWELGTRLSYLLWGSTPPDWLLDATQAGELSTSEGVRAAAVKLLEDDKSRGRVARFHSMWMGYERLPHAPTLSAAMQQETMALLDRELFDERGAWINVLRSTDTYLNTELAQHYSLPEPAGGEGWVPYADSGRRGLLSQGSFLSAVPKFSGTSPTQRGLLIRTRLFCQEIQTPPPDLGVDVDMPPEGPDPNACKIERYNMWKTDGCKSCHALMDPVGFGLEAYDTAGRFRATETDRTDCAIDGNGELAGVGSFNGPGELGELMIEAGGVDECVATQLYRLALGRTELDAQDYTLLDRLVPLASGDGDMRFYDMLLELVSAEAFRYRREEAVQ